MKASREIGHSAPDSRLALASSTFASTMPKKRRNNSWRKKKVLTKREAEIKNFNKFMSERGFGPSRKKPWFEGWVSVVQGGSPGLGKRA